MTGIKIELWVSPKRLYNIDQRFINTYFFPVVFTLQADDVAGIGEISPQLDSKMYIAIIRTSTRF